MKKPFIEDIIRSYVINLDVYRIFIYADFIFGEWVVEYIRHLMACHIGIALNVLRFSENDFLNIVACANRAS